LISDTDNIKKEGPILVADNIHKSFGKNAVLKGISLELIPGKLYGITGENGSGKTTIINILAGFWKASKGRVSIKCKVGFCPQEPHLFSNLTAEENIRLFKLAYGLNNKNKYINQQEYEMTLLSAFNLSGYEKITCSKLSEGTRQKLNLVISLLHDPDLLLLDEPYSSFDWDTYLRFWDYTEKLKERRRTILIVSHLLYDKNKMDMIWLLKNGLLECE
jgi:ABC-2 type transport system ATP-binding protein